MPADERQVYRSTAVEAVCELLEDHASKLAYLDLSATALCGVDAVGKPLLGCEYTATSVERLCVALRSEHCRLTTLKLTKCQMRTPEATQLAAAVKQCSQRGPMVQTLVLEGSSLPVPQLLGIRELSQVRVAESASACFGLLRLASACFVLRLMDSYGFVWIRMDSYGFGWIQMDSDGFGWLRMASDGFGLLLSASECF